MSSDKHTQQGPARDGGREGPGDDMTLPGAGDAPMGGGSGGVGADQSAEPVWRYQVPPPGSGAGGEQSNAGHYTPNAAGHGDGILSAPLESNVNAPGQPLSGAGSAIDPEPGTISGIQASRKAQREGGVEGMPDMASNADGNTSGSAGSDRS